MADAEILAARERLANRFKDSQIGGKGSIRRKKKTVVKASSAADDKKLGTTLKKLGISQIPGIDEVNMYKEDGEVLSFKNPDVQAALPSNLYVINGTPEVKKVQEMPPSILSQLGGNTMQTLANLRNSAQMAANNSGSFGSAAGAANDDDIPELVDNFEDASET